MKLCKYLSLVILIFCSSVAQAETQIYTSNQLFNKLKRVTIDKSGDTSSETLFDDSAGIMDLAIDSTTGDVFVLQNVGVINGSVFQIDDENLPYFSKVTIATESSERLYTFNSSQGGLPLKMTRDSSRQTLYWVNALDKTIEFATDSGTSSTVATLSDTPFSIIYGSNADKLFVGVALKILSMDRDGESQVDVVDSGITGKVNDLELSANEQVLYFVDDAALRSVATDGSNLTTIYSRAGLRALAHDSENSIFYALTKDCSLYKISSSGDLLNTFDLILSTVCLGLDYKQSTNQLLLSTSAGLYSIDLNNGDVLEELSGNALSRPDTLTSDPYTGKIFIEMADVQGVFDLQSEDLAMNFHASRSDIMARTDYLDSEIDSESGAILSLENTSFARGWKRDLNSADSNIKVITQAHRGSGIGIDRARKRLTYISDFGELVRSLRYVEDYTDESSSTQTICPNTDGFLNSAKDIEFDYLNESIYIALSDGSIFRTDYDCAETAIIQTGQTEDSPDFLALDPISEKIYWLDEGEGALYVTPYSGGSSELILTDKFITNFDILVDSDDDGTFDEADACPQDPNKAESAGTTGCGNPEPVPTPVPAKAPTKEEVSEGQGAVKGIGKDGTIDNETKLELESLQENLEFAQQSDDYKRKDKKRFRKAARALSKLLKTAEALQATDKKNKLKRLRKKLRKQKRQANRALKQASRSL